MWRTRPAPAALLAVALACHVARADEPPKSTPAPAPDAGFLEFLGGVDGLAELNPDYLKQAAAARPGAPAPKPPAPPPPPPVQGAKSND